MLPPDTDFWRFCENAVCGDREPPTGLRDRFWAYQWATRAKGNAPQMAAMRSWLAHADDSVPLSEMSDDAVIRHIADGLTTGVLHIHSRGLPGNREPLQERPRSSAAPPRLVPFPLSERRPARPSAPVTPPPPADPSTFGDIDLAAQAALLAAAAAGGTPFCPV